MKNFSTANREIKNAIDGSEPIEFKVDNDTFTAYPPTEAQFAYMMASQAEHKDLTESIAGVIDFFNGLLDEAGQETFRRRLLDRDDPLDFDMVEEIMEGLIEEWADRPTLPSPDSTVSRRHTGQSSTAKRRSTGRTSATSRSNGSATPSTTG